MPNDEVFSKQCMTGLPMASPYDNDGPVATGPHIPYFGIRLRYICGVESSAYCGMTSRKGETSDVVAISVFDDIVTRDWGRKLTAQRDSSAYFKNIVRLNRGLSGYFLCICFLNLLHIAKINSTINRILL